MRDGSEILTRVCAAIERDSLMEASSVLKREYPLEPLANFGRRYTASECMRIFVRDGFINRYSGQKLVSPGALRLLSRVLPDEFPFHTNWKASECHFAFYELFPTIDHVVPVSRGGSDREENWISTSMMRNAAKANFSIEELGWRIVPPGKLSEWDGLTGWFLAECERRPYLHADTYLRKWVDAAHKAGST